MRCIFTNRTIGMTSFSIGTNPTIGTNGPSVKRIVSVCVYWTCVFTRLTAHEIMCNNFEISLVVYMLNITTNHAITYTNIILPCVCSVMDENDIQLNLPWVTTWSTKSTWRVNCMFSLIFDIYCPTVQPSWFRRDSPDLASKLIPNPWPIWNQDRKNPDFFTYVLIFSNEFLWYL